MSAVFNDELESNSFNSIHNGEEVENNNINVVSFGNNFDTFENANAAVVEVNNVPENKENLLNLKRKRREMQCREGSKNMKIFTNEEDESELIMRLREENRKLLMEVEQDAENEIIEDVPEVNNVVQVKAPLITSNLKTMYDLNSERVKKRSEQIKKRKERMAEGDSPNGKLNINPDYELGVGSSKENNNYSLKPKLSFNSNKVYAEESFGINNNNKPYQMEPANNNNKFSNNSKNVTPNTSAIININTNADEEQTEIVVSDLECEIDDVKDTIYSNQSNLILQQQLGNQNNKSFIPLNNSLKKQSQKGVNQEKATPSYLMALFSQEEDEGEAEEESSITAKKEENNNSNTPPIGNHKHPHNYAVEDVIEEESENNTDSEFSMKKKSSFYFNGTGKKNSNMQSASSYSNYFSSPVKKGLKSPQSVNSDFNYNYNYNDNYHSSLSYSNKILPSNQTLHKTSKSDLTSIQIDMKKMINNIQNKIQSGMEDRREKINSRKRVLLDNFLNNNNQKSSSHHNLSYKKNISNSEVGENVVKKLSIATGAGSFGEMNNANTFVRPSPSGQQRAISYDDYNEMEENKINFGEENEDSSEEGNEEEVVQNNSIIEIEEEDINFEDELNNQLEKNNIDNIDKIELIEDFNEKLKRKDSEDNSQYEEEENAIFHFDYTPEIKSNNKKEEIFGSEDFKLTHGKINSENNINVTNFPSINLTSIFNNEDKMKDMFNVEDRRKINEKLKDELSKSREKNENNHHSSSKYSLEITSPENLQILKPYEHSHSLNTNNTSEKINLNLPHNPQPAIYNNNFINNNINNIQISIIHSNHNRYIKQKNNSITQDIRKK